MILDSFVQPLGLRSASIYSNEEYILLGTVIVLLEEQPYEWTDAEIGYTLIEVTPLITRAL
jgi:hypothetical protein